MNEPTRILRIHQNGRTIFSWWQTHTDRNHFSFPAYSPNELGIHFDVGEIMIGGTLVYHFTENMWRPSGDFHRIEFLYDNSLYIIEYRRTEYKKERM